MASGLRSKDKQKTLQHQAQSKSSPLPNAGSHSGNSLCPTAHNHLTVAQLRRKYLHSMLFKKGRRFLTVQVLPLFWGSTGTATRTKLKIRQLKSVFISPWHFPFMSWTPIHTPHCVTLLCAARLCFVVTCNFR